MQRETLIYNPQHTVKPLYEKNMFMFKTSNVTALLYLNVLWDYPGDYKDGCLKSLCQLLYVYITSITKASNTH